MIASRVRVEFNTEKEKQPSRICSQEIYPCAWTHVDKLLNGLQHLHVERLGLNPTQVHVTQEAVDDLQQGLLHAGETFIQQLSKGG